jgi:hypothetical protein
LVGRFAAGAAAAEQTNPVGGLAALSLAASTSVAYRTEVTIVVLAVAGGGALHLVLPAIPRDHRAPLLSGYAEC